MDPFAQIAERRIARAIERGELDDLPGRGRPLDLDSLRGVPAEQRSAYVVMRNAGVVPEEINLRKQIAELDGLIDGEGETARLTELRRRRLALELRRSLAAERRLGRL